MSRSAVQSNATGKQEFHRRVLFASDTACLANVRCRGNCRHKSSEENTVEAQLIFPYRGVFVRHLGKEESVADMNQVLFFGAGEAHQVSHPVSGGDACIVMTLPAQAMSELANIGIYDEKKQGFATRARRLNAPAQALRNLLLARLDAGLSSPLEAESLSLLLATLAFAPLPVPKHRTTRPKRYLIDRVKLFLADNLSRKISLAEIGSEVGASPVYLTQAFSQLEGMPLYRYHLRLRLAEALARLPEQKDFSVLATDLGFSSHSQFTTLFGQAFGLPPNEFLKASNRDDIHNLLKILKAMPTAA